QPPALPEKPKPPEQEPPPVEKKEEVKEAPPEPEKKEDPKEPEKEEVKKVEVKKEEPKKEEKPKEVVKKEPEKKEVIPLETEKKKEVKKEVKKEEPKKEEPKKEEKKEIAEKPKPTEKPKTEAKKTTESKKKDLESEKNKVLQDIKRQRVLEELKSGSQESAQPEEQMGEEQRLAMADSGNEPGDSEPGPGSTSESSRNNNGGGGGGSSINPVLLNLYKDKVHRKISRNWSMPPGVPTDGSLVAGVFFRVDQTGRVFDVRINSSSGNAAFDEYCVSAIRRSAPLPPPPSEFAKEAEQDGIEVSFRNASY
ncbi:MAG TPA: cell envelope integrity protein TolA, partial [Thermodesulfobacteriota bacterium]|nr:cell envelope integrity protein TolA [Thermodesulfobacteriota bacterium]